MWRIEACHPIAWTDRRGEVGRLRWKAETGPRLHLRIRTLFNTNIWDTFEPSARVLLPCWCPCMTAGSRVSWPRGDWTSQTRRNICQCPRGWEESKGRMGLWLLQTQVVYLGQLGHAGGSNSCRDSERWRCPLVLGDPNGLQRSWAACVVRGPKLNFKTRLGVLETETF